MTNRDDTFSADEAPSEKPAARSRRTLLKTAAATGLGVASLGATASTPVAAEPPDVDPENFHVYLLFGQSNMEGIGDIEPQDRETNPRVRVLQDKTCPDLDREYGNWYVAEPPLNRCWAGIGPGDYFGKTVARETDDPIHVGLVPAAVSGADIALFEKGAPIGRNDREIPEQFSGAYEWLVDLARQAQKVGTIKGILFHQGETNTGQSEWKYQVQGIVEDLKSDLGIGDVPFLAGELLYAEEGGCCASHNAEINQLPDLIPNAHVVSAEGLEGQDEAHFTTEAYREFGRRYATEMLEHVDVGDGSGSGSGSGSDCPGDATDTDGDGLCDDVDGDGELTHDDAADFLGSIEDDRVQNNPDAFDFAETGRIGFRDVVDLLRRI